MSWTFRKSLTVIPGVRLNMGRRGLGVSAGPHGITGSVSRRGRRLSAGLFGFRWFK